DRRNLRRGFLRAEQLGIKVADFVFEFRGGGLLLLERTVHEHVPAHRAPTDQEEANESDRHRLFARSHRCETFGWAGSVSFLPSPEGGGGLACGLRFLVAFAGRGGGFRGSLVGRWPRRFLARVAPGAGLGRVALAFRRREVLGPAYVLIGRAGLHEG